MAWRSQTRWMDAKEKRNKTFIVMALRWRNDKGQTLAREEIWGPELDHTQEDQEDDEGAKLEWAHQILKHKTILKPQKNKFYNWGMHRTKTFGVVGEHSDWTPH